MADKNNFNDVFLKIKEACVSRKFSPVYLFQGEETYFITQLSNYLEENALPDAEKSFNQHILYGKDVNTLQVVNYAKRFPMMGSHQLVMVKEAQHLNGLDALLPYLENPLQSTILVFCFMGKKVNATTQEGKAFQKFTVMSSEKISDYQLPKLIQEFVKAKGLDVGNHEIQLLSEYIGNNLDRLNSELEKLKVNIHPRKKVEAKDIETYVGISREYNVFELQKALGNKDFKTVNRILKQYSDDPGNNPFIFSVSMIFSFFQKVLVLHYMSGKSEQDKINALKIPPYFIKEYQSAARNYSISKLRIIMDTLHEMDLKSKGVGLRKPTDAELYKELIVKIIR